MALRRLRLARIADGEVSDVTDGRFLDTEPVFTHDGKYLAFLSRRSFDPIYDAHFFDLSFPLRRPAVPGAARRRDAVAVRPAARRPAVRRGQGGPARIGAPASGRRRKRRRKADSDSDGPPAAVAVDTAGMADRVVALPVPESRYSSPARGQGRAGLAARAGDRQPRPGRRAADRRCAAAGAGALRLRPARGQRAGR